MIRREFLKYSAIAGLLLGVKDLNAASGLINKHIVICGGGFAGLSVAKQIKELNPLIKVTVIDQKKNFISCPFSNAYLGEVQGMKFKDLNFKYDNAIKKYGYSVINEIIQDINRNEKFVQTKKRKINYDYLVMAPGIDYAYEKILGNENTIFECVLKAPAGLKPGREHKKLKKLIQDFKTGNFIITVPAGPYKCPPGPYERACMIAHYFKTHKIDGKVVILDPREKPAAKASSFLKAFTEYYKEYIEYRPLSNFKDINFRSKVVTVEAFDKENLEYKKVKIPFTSANIIPPNKANKLISVAKLALDENGFAKLRQPTFRSISDEDVYVVGDAQGEYPFPKSAQMANSCGYLVAKEIVQRIASNEFAYKKELPGNICYSMVTDKKAVSISHLYEYNPTLKVSTITSDIDKHTAKAAKGWYEGIIQDILAT